VKKHDFINGSGNDQCVRILFLHFVPVGNQCLPFIIRFPVYNKIRFVQSIKLCRSAFDDSVLFDQFILGLGKYDLALMQEHDVISDFFQVAGDVGGKQNGMVFVLNKIQKQIENIVPYHRVKTAGCFVQNQQLGIVGQGN